MDLLVLRQLGRLNSASGYTANGIAGMVCKIIAAHALGLEMTDHRFDGGAPPQAHV
jgi:hypothetical protein